MYLPTALSLAVAILIAGRITSSIGYYTPVMVAGTILLSVGAGLMTIFDAHTPAVQWIWYQIIFGAGAGLAFQQAFTAIQTVLQEQDVATAIVCLSFAQELGGIVALAISQSVFLNIIISKLTGLVPGLDRQTIVRQGTISLLYALPGQDRAVVSEVYTQALVDVFYVGLAGACATICAVGIEWKSVRLEKNEENAPQDVSNDVNEKAISS